jgi:hypothetical protein
MGADDSVAHSTQQKLAGGALSGVIGAVAWS